MVTGGSEIMEFIPHKELEGDLPAVLLEGHAHWLNLSTSILEIRPLSTLWEASSDNWKIDCTLGHYRMWKRHERLLDIRSQSWKIVSSLFKPLCTPQDLIVSVLQDHTSQPTSPLQLSIYLPGYDLSFYVDEDGDLHSRDIQGMVYDGNQYIGSLFGLVNRLVLRPKIRDYNIIELTPRCVLIPDGEVSLQTDDHHVRVEIDTNHDSGFKRVTYQTYKIDTDLGCLTGDAGLTSKLYCAYLHALTSGYYPDPLTGRSGTEEALSILQSGSCWSTARFGPRDAHLLTLIASICTPEILRSRQPMQEVKRRGILPLNLHSHELYMLSEAIKDHYERVVLCYEHQSAPLFTQFPIYNNHSPKRTAAYLFPFAVSGERSRADLDIGYHARDLVKVASGENRAYTAATCVYRRTSMSRKDIWEILEPWRKEMYLEPVWSLQYEKSWLAPNLPVIWLKTYNLLREGGKIKWFQLLFSLSAMAYASVELSALVPVFVAFAEHQQFLLEDPPSYESSDGHYPCSDTLRKYVIDCARSFNCSPESLERAKVGESLHDLKERRSEMYYSRLHFDASETVQKLLEAWPCETPPPCLLRPSLYNVMDLQSKVQNHFSNCFRNFSQLREHLTRVQKILNDLHYQASPIPDPLPYSFHPSKSVPSCIPQPLTIDRLFARPAPSFIAHDTLPRFTADINTSLSDSTPLHQLLAKIGGIRFSTNMFRPYALAQNA